MTDKVKCRQKKETNHGWGVGIVREIDIYHVMSQLGIQPTQWQELQDQQNEVKCTNIIAPSIEISQPHNDPYDIKFHLDLNVKL
ncbi:hypothetical protein [Paenibacillus andongensis]|uniref:hypothetical protein n=1 Tax=Paenibacillus andongensis TaxID=2975482 RepID=UPI0021BAD5B6|nr:hypothetical protein [Paenibacillus andongensis]